MVTAASSSSTGTGAPSRAGAASAPGAPVSARGGRFLGFRQESRDERRQVPCDQALRRAERGGPPVHVGGQRRRLERREPAGTEGADDTGEDVAATRRGQRRPPGGGQGHIGGGVAGGGHRGERPLQQDDGPGGVRPVAG